jgi:proteasome lid subunit RPN8/RPN11
MPLVLSGGAAADLRRFAVAAYPEEGCGVLIGQSGGAEVSVVEATSGRNLVTDRRRDRYELDPGAIVAAERSARERGLDVVGFWHTHPDHPARPSGFDTERAWSEYVYIIIRVGAAGVEEIRAYALQEEQGGFAEVEMSDAAASATPVD